MISGVTTAWTDTFMGDGFFCAEARTLHRAAGTAFGTEDITLLGRSSRMVVLMANGLEKLSERITGTKSATE